MSPPNYPLFLSPQAEDDFTDILQYTLETWGETQTFAYRSLLDKALWTIQQYPQIGYSHSDLSIEHRVFLAGHHLIIYKASDTAIYISRILPSVWI